MWQLEDAESLVVCWKPILDRNPDDVKQEMLKDFEDSHQGRLPFANIQERRKKFAI